MDYRNTWECQYAQREKIKGRASGGIIIEVREKIEEETEEVRRISGARGNRIRLEKDRWLISTSYYKGKIKEMMEQIDLEQEEKGRIKMMIGGDFNARTGEKGGMYDGKEVRRISRDNRSNREGDQLIRAVEENGW